MLSPSSSLPASVISVPLMVTSRYRSFRQWELRVEAPTRCPLESGLMTTVIVKGTTFACFEKKVPDHVPLKSVAVFCAEPAGLFSSLTVWAEQSEADPTVTVNDTNQGRNILDENGLIFIVALP